MRCPACAGEVPEGGSFCPSCAEPLDRPTSAPTENGCSSGPEGRVRSAESGARFLPGAVIASRYRIAGLLGRGGMGEVYRADDLKLGQPVALKFLPPGLEGERNLQQRFLDEVRVALRVTHANVCRVYDVGSSGPSTRAQLFLSMEYVDGEDLGSLLRRIGRLPGDKALEIARQLCAGLAAAHEQGILHRDLKPANVMIDGRGRAKIMDFGLAALAESVRGNEIRAGTPLYQSPEQRLGHEVTVRSDIYALGLVLYELFTGRRPFDASTPQELERAQESSAPPNPSSIVSGLDPTVETAILRCLEHDPRQRPASALAVSAALPGGDPLAAALAAGETPSPEMVADAGEAGGLAPWLGAALLAFVFAGLVAVPLLNGGLYLAGTVPLEKPPEVLSAAARDVISHAGHGGPVEDRAHGFAYDHEFLDYHAELLASGETVDDIAALWPAPIVFWYRESPRPLIHSDILESNPALVFVSPVRPEWTVPGMTGVWLDPAGRLLRFQAVPPAVDDSEPAAATPIWGSFFEAAGLDISEFSPTKPSRNPLLDCDSRFAWKGTYEGSVPFPLHVEAGGYKGKPAYFEVVPPWRADPWMGINTPLDLFDDLFFLVLLLILLVGGLLLARHNLRLGRGDRRGAHRVALFVFVVNALWWMLRADHALSLGEVWLVFRFLGYGLVVSAAVWLVYLALEPYARRLWPDLLISWSRLVTGRFRDPSIGRDILIAAAAGLGTTIWWTFYSVVLDWLSLPAVPDPLGSLDSLSGLRHTVSMFFLATTESLYFPIGWLFILLLLRALLKRQWLANLTLLLVVTLTAVPGNPNPLLFWVFITVAFGAWLFLLVRFGVLCGVTWALFFWADAWVVLTPDPSSWFFGRSLLTLLLLAGLAVYGFWISRAGRPLVGGGVLGE